MGALLRPVGNDSCMGSNGGRSRLAEVKKSERKRREVGAHRHHLAGGKIDAGGSSSGGRKMGNDGETGFL
jgi:hypothetical protein